MSEPSPLPEPSLPPSSPHPPTPILPGDDEAYTSMSQSLDFLLNGREDNDSQERQLVEFVRRRREQRDLPRLVLVPSSVDAPISPSSPPRPDSSEKDAQAFVPILARAGTGRGLNLGVSVTAMALREGGGMSPLLTGSRRIVPLSTDGEEPSSPQPLSLLSNSFNSPLTESRIRSPPLLPGSPPDISATERSDSSLPHSNRKLSRVSPSNALVAPMHTSLGGRRDSGRASADLAVSIATAFGVSTGGNSGTHEDEDKRTSSARALHRARDNLKMRRNRQGIIRGVFQSRRYDEDDIVGRRVFGESYTPQLRHLFLTGVAGVVGSGFFLMALWSFIHPYFLFCIVLELPLMAQTVLYYNVPVVKMLLKQPHVLMHMMWCVVFYCAMLWELRDLPYYPVVVIGLTAIAFAASNVPFFDSVPIDLRILLNKLITPAAVFVLCLWQVALFKNWSNGSHSEVSMFGDHLSVTSSGLASAALNNIILMSCISTYLAYRFPSCLVNIRARVETLDLTEAEANVERALERVSQHISQSNQNTDIVSSTALEMAHRVSVSSRRVSNVLSNEVVNVFGTFRGRKRPSYSVRRASTQPDLASHAENANEDIVQQNSDVTSARPGGSEPLSSSSGGVP